MSSAEAHRAVAFSGRHERSISPAVSVILPTFERRELVRRAVASVLSQSFRDFELIVVDDGSTDGTGEMLEGIDTRLRYAWQENAGVAASRNRALELARGPLIAFLDSDDRWLPDHLEVLTAVMQRHPQAVLATSCPRLLGIARVEVSGSVLSDFRHQIARGSSRPRFTACVVVRRGALEAVGRFDSRLSVGEDTDLWMRLNTLGPTASVRRETAVCQTAPDSLSKRAQRSGEYLATAERRAQNLLAVAQRAPDAGLYRLTGQARAELHLARALRALDRGERAVVAAELARATRSPELLDCPTGITRRVRQHLPGAQALQGRHEALRTLAELWPDQTSDPGRYMRVAAIAAAFRMWRPLQAGRLAANWRWRGTTGFARRILPAVCRQVHQERLKRLPSTPLVP